MDLIILSLIVLFGGSFLTFLRRKHAGLISTLTLALSLIILLLNGMNQAREYELFPELNLNFGILLDNLSFPFACMILFISTLASFFSMDFMKGKKNLHLYFVCLILFATGMYGVTFSTNLIQFYIFWELMIIPAYFLIAYWGHKDSARIGLVFFVFMHVGALLILISILWIYAQTGSFSIIELIQKRASIPLDTARWVCLLFLIGFGVKMAIVPLHAWLPDAHAEAPAPVSAMLSGLMIGIGAFGIARIVLPLFSTILFDYNSWLILISLITMFYGAIMALAQTDIKRLLAYSSISQMGYVFFGLFLPGIGYVGSILQVLNHAVVKALLFFISGILIYSTETRDMRKLGGLMKDMPLTTCSSLIAALALSGIPFLNIFVSEWMIFQGGVISGKFVSTGIAIGITFLTLAYSLWMIKRIFFGKKPNLRVRPLTLKFKLTLICLSLMIIITGIWPSLIINLLM